MTLNRNTLLRENAILKADLAAANRRIEALDLQRLLLLDQIIAMQNALDSAGLEFTFRSE